MKNIVMANAIKNLVVDFVDAVARYEVSGGNLFEFGHGFRTFRRRVFAACSERTAAGRVERAGDVAGEHDALVGARYLGIRYRYGA